MPAPGTSAQCSNCLFYVSADSSCRRDSPIPIGDASPSPTTWPICLPTDWCGEWRTSVTPWHDLLTELLGI